MGWKTIFNLADYEQLEKKKIKIYIKQKKTEGIVKNNDEIFGLAWAWDEDHEQLNKSLQLND